MRNIISIICAVLVLSLSFNSYASVYNSIASKDYVYEENPYETYFPQEEYIVMPDLIEGHKAGVTTINYDSSSRTIQLLYTYDANGNITSLTNASVTKSSPDLAFAQTLPEFQRQGYLFSFQPAIMTINYSYNDKGQLISQDYNRVVNIINEGTRQGQDIISYRYNNAGQLVSASIKGNLGKYDNSYELKYKCNPAGQITEIMHYCQGCARYKKEYSYDSLNRMTQIRNMVSNDLKKFESMYVNDFVYDENGKVVSYTHSQYYHDLSYSELRVQYIYNFNYDEHGYINAYTVASTTDNKSAIFTANNTYDSLGRIISRSFTKVSGDDCSNDAEYTLNYIY